ncbi:LssY C-terminal domain-containing protein [Leucobacter aridicollis]|uniref:LssY C-terminal domain-containing protein n=1 Tax=Leucobacter aridicollis TaxID=283878 RepID=UPI002105AAB7|nr:LssY C-terminal domain-containing protein [Leucobacter aridicollis]
MTVTGGAQGTPVPERASKRRFALQMQQPLPRATLFDRTAFLIGTIAAAWLAVIISIQSVRSPWALLLFVPVWAITAYLVLPRLHKMLSDLYVPDYFFGRTRTADGLLGDPVNLGVDGDGEQLDTAMRRAGWHRADEITVRSTWGIIVSTLTRKSYPTAPVSPLMLFGRRHDVAYQQEVAGNPKQRHHVRFWHCPPGWLLPGGAQTDWLGAGTYDTDVGFSLFTLQITHRIDENTDEERDFVVASVREASPEIATRTLRDFTTGYHARNGGGDRFITDGHLPVLDVTAVTPDGDTSEREPVVPQTAQDVVDRAPLSIAISVFLIIVSAIVDFVAVMFDPEVRQSWNEAADSGGPIFAAAVTILGGSLTLGQLFLAWRLLRRGHRSRTLLIILLALTIFGIAVGYVQGLEAIGLNGTLFSASLMCLSLLALTSESAAAWTRGRRNAGAH